MILGTKLNPSHSLWSNRKLFKAKEMEEIANSTLYRGVLVSRNNTLSDYTGPN